MIASGNMTLVVHIARVGIKNTCKILF